MSGIVGTIVEAWDELRIHRLRVLLALIGVAVAVTAITGVTAAVQMMNQAFKESADRQSGRSVTVDLYAWPTGAGGTTASTEQQYAAEFDRIIERYDITYASRMTGSQLPFRFPSGTAMVNAQVVDPDYGVITRFRTTQGRWFTDADVQRFAPVAVVNEAFLATLGATDVSSHPTLLAGRDTQVRTEGIGVYKNSWPDEPPSAYLLYDHTTRWGLLDTAMGVQAPSFKVWVPPDLAKQLQPLLRRDLAAALPGTRVDASETFSGQNVLHGATRWVVLGIGGFSLLLGGLGLVNIALVTVRFRIREIGIRRSFGATSGRVFFGVLMESVVATVVAGVVGVVIAVAVIKNIPIEKVFGGRIEDVPPFPIAAAVTGMVCATAVGALAGLIPAIVAVRVKVIDAIRY
ncbi:MAG: FtsX-like permease family protein [Cellulomonas sp.]|nr:FtsX-like permease family protein [Cellulomonas sp.]